MPDRFSAYEHEDQRALRRRRVQRQRRLAILGAIVALAMVAGGAWLAFGRGTSGHSSAIGHVGATARAHGQGTRGAAGKTGTTVREDTHVAGATSTSGNSPDTADASSTTHVHAASTPSTGDTPATRSTGGTSTSSHVAVTSPGVAVTTAGGASALAHLKDVKVAIDAGHNPGNARHLREIGRLVDAGPFRKSCDTTGTQSNAGYTEAAYAADVATRLAKQLRAAGAVVTMVRTAKDPWGPCIDQRAIRGNSSDVAISIHADGNLGKGARGFHVIYPTSIQGYTDDILPASQTLAVAVRNAFGAGTGMPRANYIGRDGLDARGDLGGLDRSDVPKVLIETGNMRSGSDIRLLDSAAWRQRAAMALALGLDRWLATHPPAGSGN